MRVTNGIPLESPPPYRCHHELCRNAQGQGNLEYIKQFPKDKKYISIIKPDEELDAEQAVDRVAIRKSIVATSSSSEPGRKKKKQARCSLRLIAIIAAYLTPNPEP
jgi:hypothetical protein